MSRAIAKLAEKIQSLNPTGGGGGEITWEHVAGAMPKSPVASLLLRVKWAGQENFLPDLLWWVAQELFRPEWGYRHPRMPERLAGAVVAEVIQPRHCPRCRGRRNEEGECVVKNIHGVMRICPACVGTGSPPRIKGREVSRYLEIDESAWRKTWKERYREMVSRLWSIEGESLQAMAKRLYGE